MNYLLVSIIGCKRSLERAIKKSAHDVDKDDKNHHKKIKKKGRV